MVEIVLVTNLENYWQGAPPAKLIDIQTPIVIGGLEGGMTSGQPSIGIIIDIEPGTSVFVQTSLKVLLAAADLLKGLYGDPRVEPSGPVA